KKKQAVKLFVWKAASITTVALLAISLTHGNGNDNHIPEEGISTKPIAEPTIQEKLGYDTVAPEYLSRQEHTVHKTESIPNPNTMKQDAPGVEHKNEPASSKTPKQANTVQNTARQQDEAGSSLSELKQIATQRFQQLIGKQQQQQFEINDALSDYAEGHGDVVFVRMLKGIPYVEERYRIGVSKDLGVTGVQYIPDLDRQVDPSMLPDPKKAIPLAQAEQAFAKQLRLAYVEKQAIKRDPFNGQPKVTSPSVQYVLPDSFYIHAETGERVLIDENPLSLQPIEVKPKAESLRVGSLEEAKEVITKQLQLDLEPSGLAQQKGDKQTRYVWENGYVLTEEKTGNVVAFNLSGKSNSLNASVLTEAQSEEMAVRFLEQYLPAGIDQLVRSDVDAGEHQIAFRFLPVFNQIPVLDRVFEVSVDRQSGQIVAFSGDLAHAPENLPQKSDLIAPEMAAKQYLSHTPLQLVYIWPKNYEKPLLVYTQLKQVSRYEFLDATTGKLIDTRP
ncbi:MAG: YcdB/YcdC domain-containing protein, partial [Clostridia bacterium]